MQSPKYTNHIRAAGLGVLLLILVGCQPQNTTDSSVNSSNEDPAVIESSTNVSLERPPVENVADGFEGGVEQMEQISETRFAGVSSDVADLLERMESCYSLQADAKSGVISADEALELQDQLGCDEIEADITRTVQQHPDQPKVAQLIQQMKATRR